jgi:hypothetical protein
MQSELRSHAAMRSRAGVLVGLAAAAGAFGVAAIMSAATAPTARADDYTELINSLNEDYGFGQTAFTAASADFAGSDFSGGLAAFFSGVNDDVLSPSDDVLIATADVLSGEPFGAGAIAWNIGAEPDFAHALSDAQFFFTEGQSFYSTAASDLTSGDYSDAAAFDGYGLDYSAILPLEALILGGAASL